MVARHASIIDVAIFEQDWLRHWSPGRRSPGDGGLSDLGLSMASAATSRKQVESVFFDRRERACTGTSKMLRFRL